MKDLVGLIIEIVTYLWPFKIVRVYERGVYYACGKIVTSRCPLVNGEPGLKLVVPFFTSLDTYHVNAHPLSLPRQSLTLADGRSLIIQVIATVVVDDVVLADTAVSDFIQSSQEQIMGIIADRLMVMEPERFEATHRGRLLGGLVQSVNAELKAWGCRCERLRFAQFALGAPTARLFNDQTIVGSAFDA